MSFQLDIVTPEKSFFSGRVDRIIVKGVEGDLAVLKNMAPIITPLAIGRVWIEKDGKERVAAVVEGYLTVKDNQATIVTDSAEWPEEIDVERAKLAKERAERRLKEKDESIDTARAEAALRRAINRLETSKLKK